MHSYKKVEVSGPAPGRHARVQQTMGPKESASIWFFTVQSGYLRRLVALSLLLGVCSASYIIAVECYADSSGASSTVEDRDSIVVSGDVDQQRDAVLANFARYNNNLETTQTSRDGEGLGDRNPPLTPPGFCLGEVKRSLISYLLRFGFIYRREVEKLPRCR
jgi:hypothetical protein